MISALSRCQILCLYVEKSYLVFEKLREIALAFSHLEGDLKFVSATFFLVCFYSQTCSNDHLYKTTNSESTRANSYANVAV